MKKSWHYLSLLAMGSAAFGQEGEAPPTDPVVPQAPKPLNTIDENFINIESGKPIIRAGTLSIGGAKGITYSRTLNSGIDPVSGYGSVWFDNLSGVINSDLGDFSVNEWGQATQYQAQYTVTVDGSSERFLNNAYDYPGETTPFDMGSEGGFLSFNGIDEYIYKNKSGNTYFFSRQYSDDYSDGSIQQTYGSSLQYYGVQGANRARITRIERADGTVVRYHYRREKAHWFFTRLQSITYSSGYQIKFNYKSNTAPQHINGRIYGAGDFVSIAKVYAINNAIDHCDPLADLCNSSINWHNIEYNSSNYSHYWKDVLGNESRIDRNEFGLPTSLFKPGENNPYISYTYPSPYNPLVGGLAMPVQTVTKGGKTWSYGYQMGCSRHCVDVSIAHPDGNVDVFRSKRVVSNYYTADHPGSPQMAFSSSGMIEKHIDGLGRITLYNWSDAYYDGHHRNPYYVMRGVVFPDQRSISYTYDSSNNLVKIDRVPGNLSGLSPTIMSNSFSFSGQGVSHPCSISVVLCGKLVSTIDFRGNATSYTYDSVHGGVLTETMAAVNGIQPVKRISYIQRYAWTKNAGGGYSPSERPIWVVDEERTCRTTATIGSTCAGGSTDEIITRYEYGPDSGPNNLQVRGVSITADAVTSRICYDYDRFGNKVSETKPSANLGVCP